MHSGKGFCQTFLAMMTTLLVLTVLAPVLAHADGSAIARLPVTYDGYLELRAPVWNSESGYIDKWEASEIAGGVKIHNVFGKLPLTLTAVAEHTFGQAKNLDYFPLENKFKVGGEFALNKDVLLFSYFDRRINTNVNRTFVGVRWNFRGGA